MQVRRKNLFLTIRTEGSILPADLLQRIERGDRELKGLAPEDYHLPGNEKINEAVSRSWTRMLGAWAAFKSTIERASAGDPNTSATRERWLLPLFQELGYGRLLAVKAVEIEGKPYPISHRWQHAPIHLVGSGVDLDSRTAGVAGAAKISPHSLVQEYLNRSEESLWGFASNGLRLRILRDNVSLTRQAFVEFDLEAMMNGEVYSDFVLLWLLCHESRVEAARPEECWLERWSRTAQEQGTRALEQLRKGVEEAIKVLGSGFLKYSANKALKEKLRTQQLSAQDYYRQLLRLVYRLLFLCVAEDRELLLDPKADEVAHLRYKRFYSVTRLRKLAERRVGTRHTDLFVALRLVMQKLGSDEGCAELGLPALGSFLFSSKAMPDLEASELMNVDMLAAIRALTFITDRHGRRLVDYKNLRSEELGSVYEALLELHPYFNTDAGLFELQAASGNERKTTGSYYTPKELVQCLLDSALDPVLEEAAEKANPEAAILDLKVCDPACGSGHFLIAAAHRIAKRLAGVRTGDEEPAPSALQKALRQVISQCIYGVDINPMAAELCKINLWLESLDPGKPLSFLDQHIQVGNSLLGATPALLEKGIPDDAFTPIEGDNKSICGKFKKLNKEERLGFQRLFKETTHPWERLGNLATELAKLENISDDDISDVRHKEKLYEEFIRSGNYLFTRLWADTWCAAFVWKKTEAFDYPITEDVFRRIERNPHSVEKWMQDEIVRLAEQYQFFHWHLAFPNVFRVAQDIEEVENQKAGWDGGFDVVVGNPPWDKVQVEEQPFFASKNEVIAKSSARVRKRLIQELAVSDPPLFALWIEYKRKTAAVDSLLKHSGRFPLTGVGKLNTYSLFAELDLCLSVSHGRVGCVSPLGIVTDEGSSRFFGYLVTNRFLVSVSGFENESLIFPTVHHSFKFCLLVLSGKASPLKTIDLVFFCRDVDEVRDPARRYKLSQEDIARLNPNTLTCPIFRNAREAEVVRHIYLRLPAIASEREMASWPVRIQRILNSTDDEELFDIVEANPKRRHKLVKADSTTWEPVYEAKMFHQFDHRFGTYVGQTEAQANQGKLPELTSEEHTDQYYFAQSRWWVRTEVGDSRTRSIFPRKWVVVFRDITSPVVQRTAILSILPHFCTTETCRCVFFESEPHFELAMIFVATFNSFVFDFVCRTKFSGNHLSTFIVKQLPMPQPKAIKPMLAKLLLEQGWIYSRVLELIYTAWDLEGFAKDCGWFGPPFRWDEERRFLLRCELDAACFHLYLGSKDEWHRQPDSLTRAFLTPRHAVDYIMDTFPIVKRKDEQAHGEY